jgi:hypothetical protein
MDKQKDIWAEGVKAIIGSTKRSLLDFIDMIPTSTSREKEIVGNIKGRIHNDLSSACLSVGMLIAAFRAGGDIASFEDTIIRKENNNVRKTAEEFFKK